VLQPPVRRRDGMCKPLENEAPSVKKKAPRRGEAPRRRAVGEGQRTSRRRGGDRTAGLILPDPSLWVCSAGNRSLLLRQLLLHLGGELGQRERLGQEGVGLVIIKALLEGVVGIP
jgi:hypothetical protein